MVEPFGLMHTFDSICFLFLGSGVRCGGEGGAIPRTQGVNQASAFSAHARTSCATSRFPRSVPFVHSVAKRDPLSEVEFHHVERYLGVFRREVAATCTMPTAASGLHVVRRDFLHGVNGA